MVVDAGVATTVVPVDMFSDPAGDQLYVFAPVAFNVVDDPAQIVVVPAATVVGNGLTVTTAVEVPLHPLVFVPVTV